MKLPLAPLALFVLVPLAACGSSGGSGGSSCTAALDAADDVIEIATDGLEQTSEFFSNVGDGGDMISELEDFSSWMESNAPRADTLATRYHDLAAECREGS